MVLLMRAGRFFAQTQSLWVVSIKMPTLEQYRENRNALLWTAIVVCIAIGLGYRGWIACQPMSLSGDGSSRYNPLAQNIRLGNGFSVDRMAPFRMDVFDVPLFPAFVASIYSVTGDSTQAVVVAQVFLDIGVIVLAVTAAHTLGFGSDVARMTLATGLVTLPLAGSAPWCLTELLSTVVLAGLMCVLGTTARSPNAKIAWPGAGALAGLAMLTRPDMIVPEALMVAVVIVACVRKDGMPTLVGLLLAVGAFVLVTFPWTMLVYRESGRLIVPGQLQFTHVVEPALSDPTPADDDPYRRWCDTWLADPKWIHSFGFKALSKDEPADFPESCVPDPVERLRAKEALLLAKEQGSFAGRPNEMFADLAAEAASRQSLVLRLLIRAKRVLLTYVRGPTNMPFPEGGTWALKPLAYGLWLGVLAAACLGFLLMSRTHTLAFCLFSALVAGRIILPFLTPFGAEPRYLFQTIPALDICAAFALVKAGDFLRRRRWTPGPSPNPEGT